MIKTQDSPPPNRHSQATGRQRTTYVSLLMALSTSLVAVIFQFTEAYRFEVQIAAMFAFLAWSSVLLSRFTKWPRIEYFLLFGMLTVATYGVYTVGSVMSPVTYFYVAGVAAAGTFMSRRVLILTIAFTLIALAILSAAEVQGSLPPFIVKVNWRFWFVQGIVIGVVGAMVFYNRQQTRKATRSRDREITKRMEMELELERNLKRFSRLFRNNPSPMLAQSASDGAILDVNLAFERCFGYKREAVVGRQDDFLWAQEDAHKTHADRLAIERLITQVPALGMRADGSHFNALISSEKDDQEDDKLIITTFTDITAQSEALEKLRRSEERFSKAFHFSPLPMSITRYGDGQLLDVNPVASGTQAGGFHAELTVAAEHWPSPESRAEFTRALGREGRLHGYETQLRKPDGSVIEARIWAELIDLDGVSCVLASCMNVTEEKRREALLVNMARGISPGPDETLFMALVNHMASALSADTVFVADIDASLTMRTLAVWSGGTPAPNFTEQLESLPEPNMIENARAQTLPAQENHAAIPSENGAGPPLYARIDLPLLADAGQVIGMLSAQWKRAIQMTSEARALMSIFSSRATAEMLRHRQEKEVRCLNATLEDRVRSRTAELEQVNAELDSFAYSVSHDLKSPLRAIDGFTHIMLEDFEGRSTEQERGNMNRILAATHRMSDLIKDLLALARISQSALRRKPVNLSLMAEEILRQASRPKPERPWILRIQPDMVEHCDEGLVRIALTHLLNNAVKYECDQAKPVIEFGQTTGADGTPSYFVRDNGVGFDMAHIDKLFKPFQRLHMPNEFQGSGSGSGIGLATVRRIVERHGGSIKGEATPGQGALFTFNFGGATAFATP